MFSRINVPRKENSTKDCFYITKIVLFFVLVSIWTISYISSEGLKVIIIGKMVVPLEKGTMNVEDKIFIPSNQIQKTSTRLDFAQKYPEAHPPNVIMNKDSAGYIPWSGNGKFSGRTETTLFELKNEVVTTETVLIRPSGYHLFKYECHPRFWGWTKQQYHNPTINFTKYDMVTSIGHQHTTDFGHWFLEILPAFAILPSYIVENTYIALPIARNFVVDGLEFFGYSKDRIIEGINFPVFARTLYTVQSSFCGDLNWFLIIRMRDIMIQRLGLNKKAPHRFVMINRVNRSREIENWKELLSSVRGKWPQFEWEELSLPNTMAGQLRLFNEMKFVFAIHGSILSNIISMQDNTAVIEVQMENWLLSFIWLGIMTGKYLIEGRDSRIAWTTVKKYNVDIPYMLRLIEAGLKSSNSI